MSSSEALDLHVTLFNRYKELVSSSRSAICRHIQYLLKPNAGYPTGSDAKLKQLLEIWDADSRAMDAALKEKWHSAKPLPVMPPDDAEHQLCRRMAAIHIEVLMYGEHSAQHFLEPMIDEILNSSIWRDMAYHPPSCACQKFDMWTYGNIKKVEVLKDAYDRIVNGCRGGADGPAPTRKRVDVLSPRYSLNGSYEVTKCEEGYVFILKVPMDPTQAVDTQTLVPLEEPMGVHEFFDVTPEKFNW